MSQPSLSRYKELDYQDYHKESHVDIIKVHNLNSWNAHSTLAINKQLNWMNYKFKRFLELPLQLPNQLVRCWQVGQLIMDLQFGSVFSLFG